MSIIKLSNNFLDNQHLTHVLASEFAQPSEEYRQPLISIEQHGTRTHLLVVWDEWKSLSQQDRSVIIMDAYGQAKGDISEAIENVSVAMGLTQEEAENLGYQYQAA